MKENQEEDERKKREEENKKRREEAKEEDEEEEEKEEEEEDEEEEEASLSRFSHWFESPGGYCCRTTGRLLTTLLCGQQLAYQVALTLNFSHVSVKLFPLPFE